MASSVPSPAPSANPVALSALLRESSKHAESLWEKAFQTLSSGDQQRLNSVRGDKLTVLNDVRSSVEEKWKVCLEKRWAFTKNNGERVILRDLCEKIVMWIDKFKAVGDVITQYDPAHTALPWAGIRFILQASVNDHQTFYAMIEGVERAAHMVARCTILEIMHFGKPSNKNQPTPNFLDGDLEKLLKNSLVVLYAAILHFLAKAGQYYNRKTRERILRSIVEPPEAAVKSANDAMIENEEKLYRCLQLVTQKSTHCVINQTNEIHHQLGGLMQDLEDPINRIAIKLSELDDKMKGDQRRDLLRWLSKIPCKKHHRAVSETRLAGSGKWLLQKADFREWRKSSMSSVLWLHGIPGSGKTHLVSLVVDTLLGDKDPDHNVPCAFFYCYRDPAEPERSDPDEILRCILKQLCSYNATKPVREPVASSFQERKNEAEDDGLDPEPLTLRECTVQILEILVHNPAIIILDALDECDQSRRHRLLESLESIIQDSSSLVKILIASRDDTDIRRRLDKAHNIYIDASDNSKDIEDFVRKELDDAIKKGRLLGGNVSAGLRNQIHNTLVEGAHGMFQWVSLQIQNLCDSNRSKLLGDVQVELGKLPMSLKESYDKIYYRISGSAERSRVIAERAISWLLCAYEPLELSAFIAAATTDDWGASICKDDILNICCNLVVFDNVSKVFRFAHLSVREYLEGRPEYSKAKIHTVASGACLDTWNMPWTRKQGISRKWMNYSAKYLPQHLRDLELAGPIFEDGLDDKMSRFVHMEKDEGSPCFDWANFSDFPDYFTFTRDGYPEFQRRKHRLSGEANEAAFLKAWSRPFCLCVASGMTLLVTRMLVTQTLDLNQEQRTSCLVAAAANGNVPLMKLLVSNGFLVTMEVTLRIIEWLQHDAKAILDIVLGKYIPEMTEEIYEAACGNPFCSKEILAYFFLRYPERTVRKRIIRNAVLSGDPAFVKALLSQGLKITLTRRFVIGMSQREGGKGPLMKLLLRSEPQTRITDETAQAVAEHFDHPLFQTLLNRRDFRQEWITAALVSAIQPDRAHGGAGAIRALLRHDAAAALRHVPLRALVAFADAAHVRAHLAGQPRAVVSGDVLLAAVGSRWHTDANSRAVVKLLVERPRTPTPSADAQAALAAAAVARALRRPFLLRLLLGRGLVVPPCGALEVGLRAATAEGNWIVVFMLLDHGVDVDAADGDGDTALKIARRGGHRWLANELVMRGGRG